MWCWNLSWALFYGNPQKLHEGHRRNTSSQLNFHFHSRPALMRRLSFAGTVELSEEDKAWEDVPNSFGESSQIVDSQAPPDNNSNTIRSELAGDSLISLAGYTHVITAWSAHNPTPSKRFLCSWIPSIYLFENLSSHTCLIRIAVDRGPVPSMDESRKGLEPHQAAIAPEPCF